MALKQEVEDAPLTQDGLTIDLELGTIATQSPAYTSTPSSRSRAASNHES